MQEVNINISAEEKESFAKTLDYAFMYALREISSPATVSVLEFISKYLWVWDDWTLEGREIKVAGMVLWNDNSIPWMVAWKDFQKALERELKKRKEVE